MLAAADTPVKAISRRPGPGATLPAEHAPGEATIGDGTDKEPAAHLKRGRALLKAGDAAGAESHFRRAIALAPQAADAHAGLGVALRRLDRPEEAIAAHEAAIARAPGDAHSHNNMGLCQIALARPAEALAAYEKALVIDAENATFHLNAAIARLALGRLAEGWAEYEWRWRTASHKSLGTRYGNPTWDGGPLDGRRILLFPEQGVGDAIQFVRYAPLVAAPGGEVVLGCPPSLRRLFGTVAGVSRVIVRQSQEKVECQASLMSLPRILGTEADTIPADVPYLAPPEDTPLPPIETSGTSLRVGIAWSGNPKFPLDRHRSIPLARFAPLAANPGLALVSLQVGERAAEVAEFPGPIVDLAPYLTDFAATARAIAALDVVISVDTAVAHLAGALGKPVWTLVPFSPDWRWQLARADSPWYPTMRLFRQRAPGNWDSVFARITTAFVGLSS